MSWNQWPQATPPPVVATAPAPLLNPAPSVVPPGLPYSTDQWTQMQQQNWQQWAQWQQQYQQWHQQYGAEYQKSINALAAQQTVLPTMGLPPPLPVETQATQPPLPQDEIPKPAPPLPVSQLPTPQYSTQTLSNKFSTPPPNFSTMPPRQQEWKSTTFVDQKRPLPQPDDSTAKRLMLNKQPSQQQQQPQGNWRTAGNAQITNVDELSEAEKKFDKQFAEWEAQFNKWKDQNSGHPDKEQYREYEKKWEQWRQQLLERREAMRKKRLALSALNNKVPNFSVPPPSQHTTMAQTLVQQKQGLLPHPTVAPKDALLPTPTLFNKPPPDMNNEPLQFRKPPPESLQTDENLGFLNTTRTEGIPGLDLVRDDEESEEIIDVPAAQQKGPDLEAISKGISNILGDQKLMSMLSMVSQNQNISQHTNYANQNPNCDDSRIELVQNIDDQTRSSFTMQPSDSDFYRGGPINIQMNRANFDDEQSTFHKDQFEQKRFENRQVVDEYQRLPLNRKQNHPPPLIEKNFDSLRETSVARGAPMGRNLYTSTENFERDNFVQDEGGGFNIQEDARFRQGFSRNEFNGNKPGSRFNRSEFVANNQSNSIGLDRDRFRGEGRKANASMNMMNRNNFQMNRGNADFGEISNDFPLRRGTNESVVGRNFSLDDYDYTEDDFDCNNVKMSEEYERNCQIQWNKQGGRNNEQLNDKRSINHLTAPQLNKRIQDTGPFEISNNKPLVNSKDGNFGRINSRDEEHHPPPPSLLDLQLVPPVMDAPEPPQFNGGDCLNSECDPEPPKETSIIEDIWKPTTVIDYDHKSLQQQVELDILVEPFRMFDYRHKQLRRIPFPERPNWLSDAVRMIPEFDPPLIRASLINERRLYKDRVDEDLRYDPKERLRYERKAYGETRKRSYEESSWPDKTTKPSRLPSKFEVNRGNRKSWNVDEKNWDEVEDWENRDWTEEKERCREDDDMDLDHRERNRDRNLFNKNFERECFNKRTITSIFPLNEPEEKKSKNVTLIEDIISPPGRFNRPPRIVIILRGPPGSGKTHLAKLIKDKEMENGGSAPRILSLDDYFMVEQEKEVIEDGRRTKTKEMVYEFEAEMEESYRTSLMKSFKKTITDGYFPFIIVDNVNDKVKYFGEMWSFAKQNGFQVFICEMDLDVQNCTRRNIHNRTEEEIRRCVEGWENTPSHHPILDASSLTQELIPEVEMEEIDSPCSTADDKEDGLEIKPSQDRLDRSKWDNFDCSINNLAKLDGVNKPLRPSRTMEEYLQLDDLEPSKPSKPGQKRVRWADLEERKKQEKMRAIGFVVGQTNWDRMMDPTVGESALTQTKYIEKVGRSRF